MESFVKADIFFVVTTYAIIIGIIFISIISYYVVKILRDVKEITAKAKKEVIEIVEDVGELREDLMVEGRGLISKAFILSKFISKKVTPRKRTKKNEHKETE